MRSVADLRATVAAQIRPLEPFALSLTEAFGCILAEDVVAQVSHPAFDNAATDGYAVRSADLAGAGAGSPVTLPVVGEVAAGSWDAVGVSPGTALRIVAGAPVPAGADAVLADALTDRGMVTVSTQHAPAPGDLIRRAARDFAPGAPVASRGTRVGVNEMALLAATGRSHVVVQPTPRAVVLSCGDELVEPGTPPRGGKVVDVNSYALTGAVRETGAVAFRLPLCADDPDRLGSLLDDNLVRGDVVVTTGGTGGGERDVMQRAFRRLGTVTFERIAVDPGSSYGFGVAGPDDTPVFCLPGNTDSALLGFELFVRPSLRAMAGLDVHDREELTARLTAPVTGVLGARSYRPARLDREGEHAVVTPVGGTGARHLVALTTSNAFIVLDESRASADAGESVTVLPLGATGGRDA